MKKYKSTEKQRKSREKQIANLLPHQFKKGQSGNPAGRPPGKTLKEYTREMLAAMTDEERQEFLQGIPKEVIWKMVEGNPKEEMEIGANDELKAFIAKFNNLLENDKD